MFGSLKKLLLLLLVVLPVVITVVDEGEIQLGLVK